MRAEAPDAKHDWELINQESTEIESDEWYGGHFVRMTSVTEINTYRVGTVGAKSGCTTAYPKVQWKERKWWNLLNRSISASSAI
jgi:hypothetical protein